MRGGGRRRPAGAEAAARLRALAGGALAVGVVAGGIGALLLFSGPPDGSPAVAPAGLTAPDQPGTASDDALPGDSLPGDTKPGASGPSATQSGEPLGPGAASMTPRPAVTSVPPAAPAAPVTVLNNSRIVGLAERTADRLRGDGWPVVEVGSLRGRIRASTVYYAAGQQAAAQQLARRYAVPRVLPRLAGLPGSGLTLVVTRDRA